MAYKWKKDFLNSVDPGKGRWSHVIDKPDEDEL